MSFKYDVVHFRTEKSYDADIPAKLKDKMFTSFNKVVAAICDATPVGTSCTVRKVEAVHGLGDVLMGFREVTPEEDDSYSYQRGWALEY